MLKFAAIDERREVADVNGADRSATIRPEEKKLHRYNWNVASSHRHRTRIYRARLAAAFEKFINDLLPCPHLRSSGTGTVADVGASPLGSVKHRSFADSNVSRFTFYVSRTIAASNSLA